MVTAGFMRVYGDFYARSQTFMRVRELLCALTDFYARSRTFMRAHFLQFSNLLKTSF